MSQRRMNVLLILCVIGVAVGSYLSFVALDKHVEAFCSGVGNCHTVQNSQYAKVGGVPVAILGLGMYVALLAMTVVRRFDRRLLGREAPAILGTWTFALAFAGMLYSGYLTYLELFVIDAICVWCVGSAITVTIIAVVALPGARPRVPVT
jgi:uncharacterized membrane protein